MRRKILILLASVAVIGCKPDVQPTPAGDTSFVSKVSLGWEEGDELSVFNGVGASNAMYRCSSVGDKDAVFDFVSNGYSGGPSSVSTDGSYISVYPFSENYSVVDGTVNFTLPSTKSWTGNSTVKTDHPIIGFVKGGRLTASPVFATLRLALQGNVILESISVESETPIAGTFAVDADVESCVAGSDAAKTLAISFGDGQQLTTERSTNVDIVLPAGTYDSLAITATDSDGNEFDLSTVNLTLTAGKTISKSSTLSKEKVVYKPWPEEGMESKTYITNGIIQIGVDMDRGGCIFHFSDAVNKVNVLNHYDNGRFVQQSFYGDADGSKWGSTDWCYNPVQGGGYKSAYPARIESSEVKSDSLACTSIPYHWAACVELDECRMTEVITLEGEVAHMHYTFTYDGTASYASRHQEMPAVFCNYEYSELYYYNGAYPWQGKDLSHLTPSKLSDTGNQYLNGNEWSEKWAAYINSSGYGVGVYDPTTTLATYYRTGNGPSGADKSSCSYFAPLGVFGLTPGLVKTYDVYMTTGSAEEIRSRFYQIHAKQ